MAYSTAEQVRLLLKGVDDSPATDYDLTADKLSDAQIEADIVDADSEIDAALGDRYTVPFPTPIPPLVTSLSINIAAYLADLRFRGGKEHASELSPFYLRYRRSRQILNSISEGRGTIPGLPDDALNGGGSEVFNPYDGILFNTAHIWTRWPEGVINDG